MIRVSCILLALVALVGLPPGAQIIPLGNDFQVNELTTGDQRRPKVGLAADGSFVVAWQGDVSSGSDTSSTSLQARRFGADGAPSAGDFQVNTYTTGPQYVPSIRMEPAGEFVVAWIYSYSIPFFPDPILLTGQRFDAQGTMIAGEFMITDAVTYQGVTGGVIAGDGDGGFFGVMASNGNVYGRRMASDDTPLGHVNISEVPAGFDSHPRVAVDSVGNFVVVWASDGSPAGDDISGLSIQARTYNLSGLPTSSQFQVNQTTTGDQTHPDVALLDSGRFLATWTDEGVGDGSASRILGQLLDPGGVPAGSELQINTTTRQDQHESQVVPLGGSSFVVVWQNDAPLGAASDTSSIQGQILNAEGLFLGEEIQIATQTTGTQRRPGVDANGDGFVVVWDSDDSPGSDTSGLSIQARRFRFGGVFSDGFESGDLMAWSGSQPPGN